MKGLSVEELKAVNGGSRVTGDGYYVFVGTSNGSGSGSGEMLGPYGSMSEAESVGKQTCINYYLNQSVVSCHYSVSYYCDGAWTDYPDQYVEKPVSL